jgi:hypothetical protein
VISGCCQSAARREIPARSFFAGGKSHECYYDGDLPWEDVQPPNWCIFTPDVVIDDAGER